MTGTIRGRIDPATGVFTPHQGEGTEPRRREVNPEVAMHEARHVAAALLLGLKVAEARADNPPPDPYDNGYVQLDPSGFRPRARAIMALVGNWGDAGWPPERPSASAASTDERQIAHHVDDLGIGQSGYELLVADAKHLAGTSEFKSLVGLLEPLLRQGIVLRPPLLTQVHEVACGGAQLGHKAIKATARATTDLGEFSAIAAAYSIDRDGDQIVQGAFRRTIERWQASGKQIPLHWNHSPMPKDIIGSIDPASMREIDDGLFTRGKLDLDGSGQAREVWPLVKANVMSLSFGYLATDTFKRDDGVQELREIDLFEISIVPAPANPDTRILSYKSADPPESETERERAREIGRYEIPRHPLSSEDRRLRDGFRDEMYALLTAPLESGPEAALEREEKRQARQLRRECDRLLLEASLGWDTELIALARGETTA